MEKTWHELQRNRDHAAFDSTPQIDAIVLLDRSVDLVTVLSTQLTYEGLIDEIYEINYSEFSRVEKVQTYIGTAHFYI